MSHKWFFDESVTSARAPLNTKKMPSLENPKTKHDNTSSREPTAIEKTTRRSNVHKDPLGYRIFPDNHSIDSRGLCLLWEEMEWWERRGQPSRGLEGPPAWKNLGRLGFDGVGVAAVMEQKWVLGNDEVGEESTRTGRGWSEWTLWLLRGPSYRRNVWIDL